MPDTLVSLRLKATAPHLYLTRPVRANAERQRELSLEGKRDVSVIVVTPGSQRDVGLLQRRTRITRFAQRQHRLRPAEVHVTSLRQISHTRNPHGARQIGPAQSRVETQRTHAHQPPDQPRAIAALGQARSVEAFYALDVIAHPQRQRLAVDHGLIGLLHHPNGGLLGPRVEVVIQVKATQAARAVGQREGFLHTTEAVVGPRP